MTASAEDPVARVVEFVAEQLGVDASTLSTETGVGDLPEWDSLAHVELLSALESWTGREIDPDAAFDIETLGDVVDFVAQGD